MNKRTNILICAYCIDKDDVGEAKMAYEWIVRLSESCNLNVVTTGSRLHEVCGLENRKNITLNILKPKIKFRFCDSFDRAVHPGYIEFFLRARKVIREVVSQQEINLCHHLTPRSFRYPSPFITIPTPFVVGPFHGGLKAPAVMKELGTKEELFYKLRTLDRVRLHVDLLLRRHYKKASRLVISAPYVKDVLLPCYRAKCVVIPPPPPHYAETGKSVSIERYHENSTLQMMFVGRLVPSKGLELLLLAISICRNKNIRLSVYGRGPLEKHFHTLSSKLGLSDRIVWKGFVPYDEIRIAYYNYDVFAFPSLKEPTGIALTEAMACGLPAICVDAGGPAYIVQDDCGIKIPLSNKEQMVKELANAIDVLACNPERRRTMGRCAQDRIHREFTWGAVVNKMLKVYEEVIDENCE